MDFKRIKSVISLFKKLYWRYRFRIFILIGLSSLSGALGALGIAALVPLFSFIVKEGGASDDIVSRFILGAFSYINVEPGLATLLIFICTLFILKAVILWIFGYARIRIVATYAYNTKRNLYQKTLQANWVYLLKHKLGYLENILMLNVGVSVKILKRFIALILKSTSLAMYLIVAFSISSFITLITLGAGGFILLCTKPFFYRIRVYGRRADLLTKELTHQINENIVGLKTVKIMNAEKDIVKKGIGILQKIKENGIRAYLISSFTSQPVEPFMFIFISVLFALSYSFQPNFNIATFLVVMYLVKNIFDFTKSTQAALLTISSSLPYIQRVGRFQSEIEKSQEQYRGGDVFKFASKLEFQNVNFSYNSQKSILKNINFQIKKGEMFGIIGPTGEGKTTIADLLLRFFDLGSGKILVDGKDIAKINLSDWRKNIGYVSQDIFLKNDTIENNIRFYDERILEADIIEAAKKANIYDFIQTLPDGFKAVVGERGVFLSGGQRQRIVLARAFVRKPKILILDEATSSLDNQSEALIRESIEKSKGELTIIVITHRLSLIMNSDHLIALKDGQIIEKGLPKQLLMDTNSYLYKAFHA